MKVYGLTVYSREAAAALGDAPHIRQVRAFSRAANKRQFIEALARAGLWPFAPSTGMREATDTGNAVELATAEAPGRVYVRSMQGGRREPIPWPPPERP